MRAIRRISYGKWSEPVPNRSPLQRSMPRFEEGPNWRQVSRTWLLFPSYIHDKIHHHARVNVAQCSDHACDLFCGIWSARKQFILVLIRAHLRGTGTRPWDPFRTALLRALADRSKHTCRLKRNWNWGNMSLVYMTHCCVICQSPRVDCIMIYSSLYRIPFTADNADINNMPGGWLRIPGTDTRAPVRRWETRRTLAWVNWSMVFSKQYMRRREQFFLVRLSVSYIFLCFCFDIFRLFSAVCFFLICLFFRFHILISKESAISLLLFLSSPSLTLSPSTNGTAAITGSKQFIRRLLFLLEPQMLTLLL